MRDPPRPAARNAVTTVTERVVMARHVEDAWLCYPCDTDRNTRPGDRDVRAAPDKVRLR